MLPFCSPSIVCVSVCVGVFQVCLCKPVLDILSFPDPFSFSSVCEASSCYQSSSRHIVFNSKPPAKQLNRHHSGPLVFWFDFITATSGNEILLTFLFRTVKESLGGRSRYNAAYLHRRSLHRQTCSLRLVWESRAVGTRTYWSLSVRSINASLASRGYEQCGEGRHTAGWPIIISLHFLSGLQSSCLSSGCCMISTVQDQQPWHADSQNLQAPLILNDCSCITETVLFLFSQRGCLEVEDEGMGLHHWCNPPDSLRIVLVRADQCNMLILLVSCVTIACCLVAMQCVVPYYSCQPLCKSPQQSWRILCKNFLLLLFIIIPRTRFSLLLVHSVKGLLTCSSCSTQSSSDLTVMYSNCTGNKSCIFTFLFSEHPFDFWYRVWESEAPVSPVRFAITTRQCWKCLLDVQTFSSLSFRKNHVVSPRSDTAVLIERQWRSLHFGDFDAIRKSHLYPKSPRNTKH